MQADYGRQVCREQEQEDLGWEVQFNVQIALGYRVPSKNVHMSHKEIGLGMGVLETD